MLTVTSSLLAGSVSCADGGIDTVPAVLVTDVIWIPSGRSSVTTTDAASEGPALETTIV